MKIDIEISPRELVSMWSDAMDGRLSPDSEDFFCREILNGVKEKNKEMIIESEQFAQVFCTQERNPEEDPELFDRSDE